MEPDCLPRTCAEPNRGAAPVITEYHAKLFAHELSRRHSVADAAKLAGTLLDAQVDLNPHQVEAASAISRTRSVACSRTSVKRNGFRKATVAVAQAGGHSAPHVDRPNRVQLVEERGCRVTRITRPKDSCG